MKQIKNQKEYDFLIIGAGIVGLSIARNLINRFPSAEIAILEKEADVACHSSGRNSGVIHAGFYYTADSLKAKLTKDGNRQLKEFCYKNKLKINEAQKVVVAKNKIELQSLFELEKRGKINDVRVKLIDENQLKIIDSNVKTYKYALLSPTTATVDPVEVSKTIKNELITKGVVISFNEGYKSKILGKNEVITNQGNKYKAKKIINAAGLFADHVAKDFNFSKNYTIIPFKGVYLNYHGKEKPVNINVYPVLNLKNPFLGVHFTVNVDGSVKIGPTAIPAFWRENYRACSNFRANEMLNILSWESRLFVINAFGFRNLAINEIKKYNKNYLVNIAFDMVKKMDIRGFKEWGKPGIRAQLLNINTKELVMDFIVESNKDSVHILNAVSPAFTCCFSFANWVVENHIISRESGRLRFL